MCLLFLYPSLNGCTHKVITGVALVLKQKKDATAKLKTFHVTSDVMFSQMELEFIQDYVDSGEPLLVYCYNTNNINIMYVSSLYVQ